MPIGRSSVTGMRLEATVAVVTGGSSGLGAATVEKLASKGATVVVADMDRSGAEEVAKRCAGSPGRVVFVPTDVTSASSVASAVDEAVSHGPIGVCVSCAGIVAVGKIIDRAGSPGSLEEFEKVMGVNLIGTYNVMRLVAAAMVKNEPGPDGERGVIVNTSSIAAFEGQIGQVAYAASKGGVASMTIPAARDLAPAGIRVMAVAPGVMDTPMLSSLPQAARESLAAGVPFPKRLGTPEDFASLVAHICENTYLNGGVIRLDGALRMAPR